MGRTAGDFLILQTVELDLAVATPVLTFRPRRPALVHRIGCISSVDVTGVNLIIQANHEIIGGGALSPSGANMAGNITGLDDVIGDGFYKEAGDFPQGEPILVLPSEQLEIDILTAATAGDGHVWIEYQLLPFVDANYNRKMSDGTIGTGSYLDGLTKVLL